MYVYKFDRAVSLSVKYNINLLQGNLQIGYNIHFMEEPKKEHVEYAESFRKELETLLKKYDANLESEPHSGVYVRFNKRNDGGFWSIDELAESPLGYIPNW